MFEIVTEEDEGKKSEDNKHTEEKMWKTDFVAVKLHNYSY